MDNLIPCFQPSAIAKTVSEVLGQESIAQEHLAARSPLKSLDLNCHVRENFDDSSEDIPRVYSNLSQNTPVGVAEQLSRSDSTPVADLQQLCISTSTRVVAQQQPSIPCTPLAGQQQPSSVTPVEAQQSSSSSSTPVSVSEQSHSIVGEKKDELKATYVAHGFELTGYVVVIGKLGAIESTHVVIGSHTYNLPGRGSLLRAVDICFKCIVALHKTFPRASTEVWSFFETEVYKVRSGPDPSLSELVGKIEMFIKSKKQAEAAKALSSNRASSSSISS
ncbi:hypothetical protein QAD02_008110 [Eretmocerus hayati]|uniref:Uncharacterized protein n=1 Tax=Eretmocerus hayati TaxID=131215 RepID=A0ACC2N665_9HYME|nr:hypothetical protein QAD02_008110 [Eretmocerus hayati]